MKHPRLFKYVYYKETDELFMLNKPVHRVHDKAREFKPFNDILMAIKNNELKNDNVYVYDKNTDFIHEICILERPNDQAPDKLEFNLVPNFFIINAGD